MELMDLLFLEPKAIESINAMDPIGPLAAHRSYLKGRSPTSQLIPCSCMKPFAAPVY